MYVVEPHRSGRWVIRNTDTNQLVTNRVGRIETFNTEGYAALVARGM